MTHEDKIKDTDAFFEVNPITRQIINKTPAKIVLMQGDHNSERFTFSLPRYIEGHDMAESANANLHYINASKNVKGMYVMTDLRVDPENEENVICSWLISGNATKEAGKLSFLIEFECYEGNVLVYSWHSLPYEGISVGGSFDNAEEIAEMYADVLQQWHDDLFEAKGSSTAPTSPFYKERKYYADVDLSNCEIDENFGAYAIDIEGLAEVEYTPMELILEIDDNGTTHKATAYFDGESFLDKCAYPVELGEYYIVGYYDPTLFLNAYGKDNLNGVTLKIYEETAKKIEKEYLPKCDVPYIYSDTAEDVVFGRVALDDLDSGAYLLHGVFDTVPNMWNFVYHFANKPTLCHITNDHEGTVKLYWLDEDEQYEDSVCVRSMCIDHGEVVSDNAYSLLDIAANASGALDMVGSAYDTANAAQDGVYALFEEMGSLQEGVDVAIACAEEACSMASAAIDDFRVYDFIVMKAPNNNLYQVKLDNNGNLTTTIME